MNGIERIRTFLERAFAGKAQTEKVLEAKEALYADLIERYQSLIQEGYAEEAAYQAAISSIGDIFELVDSITGETAQTGPVAAKVAEGNDRVISQKASVRLPYILVGIFFLLWIGRYLLPVRPHMENYLPMLFLGVAAGLVAPRLIMLYKQGQLKGRKMPYLVLWSVTAVLFLIAIFTPRFERAIWLLPVLALAIHQLLYAWQEYDSSKKENSHE